MKGRWFSTGLLAVLGVLAGTVPTRAGDTILLNRVENTPTQTLVDDGRGADTIQTQFRRGFGFGGFNRGFGFGGFNRGFGFGGFNRGFGFGGFNRGFGFGGFPRFGFGGFRGFGFGGFRGFGFGGFPVFGFGGFPGFGWGGGFSGFGLGGGFSGFGWGGVPAFGWGGGFSGFGFPLGIGYGGFYGPCSGGYGGVYTLAMPAPYGVAPVTTAIQPRYLDYYAPSQAPRGDGTYPYDGGPSSPVPNPKATPVPQSAPQRSVPLEGRAVSLPKSATKWAYPAYGETPRRTSFAEDQTLLAKGQPRQSRSR
jgi:hypothetical protein